MASYQELHSLYTDSDLQEKVEVALIVAMQTLLAGTPSADQQKYAAAVFANARAESKKALMYVLAANKDVSVATIQAANDATIQTHVDNVVDALVVAYNAA